MTLVYVVIHNAYIPPSTYILLLVATTMWIVAG